LRAFDKRIDIPSQDTIWEYLVYGDVHWGATACDEDLFKETILRFSKRPNCYFISIGDELNAIPLRDERMALSELKARIAIDPEDGELRDDIIAAQILDYKKFFKNAVPADRDLGHTSGNHPAKLAVRTSSADASEELCSAMGREWLGYSWRYRVDITVRGKKRAQHNISGHHGFGSSRTPGTDMNRYVPHASRQRDVDICLYGHSHLRWVCEVEEFNTTKAGKAKILAQRRLVLNCGTFLKTMSVRRQPTYSEIGGYMPAPLGCWIIRNKIIKRGGVERIYSWALPSETPAI
jgi:hypothetical protein